MEMMPEKVRQFSSREELIDKLDGKHKMWTRVARENQERADDFEVAAQAIRDGAVSVTVGRTTYELTGP